MIEDVRALLLNELNQQRNQYKEILGPLYDLEQKKTHLEYDIDMASVAISTRTHFSFWEKFLTRRSEFKKYKEQEKRVSAVNHIEDEIAKFKAKHQQEIEAEYKIAEKIDKVTASKTIYEMGISPVEAVQLIENSGKSPVLTEADKTICYHHRAYSSKSSLIGVHKTDFAPIGNVVKSSLASRVQKQEIVTINGVDYKVSYNDARDTVHMAMNGEVSRHARRFLG